MADFLGSAMGWLAGVFTDQCSVDVSVTQDALTATVPATLGRSTFERDTGSGIIDRWESRDFLIEHAEWIAAGFSALPKLGATIAYGGATYVVQGPARDAPAFTWDPDHLVLAVHSQQQGA